MNGVIKDYFTFSGKERIAIIILLLLIGSFISLPYFYSAKKKKPLPDQELRMQMAQLQPQGRQQDFTGGRNEDDWQQQYPVSSNLTPQKFELFDFDPNTLDAGGWKKLGLSDKTIHTIFNFRNKGGKFHTPEDLRKIWGLKKEEADRMIPYAKVNNPLPHPFIDYRSGFKRAVTTEIPLPVDVNTATPEQLMQLPGMDHSIPYRIIRFREQLRGFWDLEQIKQTYGMSDSVYKIIRPFLKIDSTTLPKININACTVTQLNREPYISRTIAQAIILYRNHHGVYQKVEDIKKIAFLTNEMFQKIAPYLTIQ
jgi:DNA uptake protein ComE-like DNA-binding protein